MAHAKMGKFFVTNVSALNKGEFVRFDTHSEHMGQCRSDYVLLYDVYDNGPILAEIDDLCLIKGDDGQVLGLELWVKIV